MKSTETTIVGNVKMVRTQKESPSGKYSSTNKYYVNGKLVHGQERWEVESKINNTPVREWIVTRESNFPTHN